MKGSIKIKTDKTIEVVVVGGAKPYVWIGDGDGHYLGTVDDARELRDALTKALHSASREP